MAATKTAKPKATPAAEPVQAPALPPVMPAELLGEVPLSSIRPCSFNIRKAFPDSDVQGLAESIRAEGLINRLIVRPVGLPGQSPTFARGAWSGLSHYELADGERRYRALTLIDATHTNDDAAPLKVGVVIRPLTDDQVLAMMVTTREQSRDLAVSELLAGYTELRARKPDDNAVAAAVGKPVSHVRGVLRLSRLPRWALAAIDAGVLPRATAELVARVPGEESRKRCAACVLLGYVDPELLKDVHNDADTWEEATEAIGTGMHKTDDPLSYRDTKALIRNHFTQELKGSPFSLKVVYLEADGTRELPTCDECPNRAGNDPEATADGIRADVCLEPSCYRTKVSAYRAAELAKAVDRHKALPVPADFSWYLLNGRPPAGWLEVSDKLNQCGDIYSACVMPAGDDRRDRPLDKLLNKALPQQYLAFDREGKPRRLLKCPDVRAALTDLGVIPAPKPPKKAPPTKEGSESGRAAIENRDYERPKAPARGEPGWQPSLSEVDARVAKIAGQVAYEMGAENADGLEGLTALGDSSTNAAWEALKILALWQAEEFLEEATHITTLGDGVTNAMDVWGRDDNEKGTLPIWKSFVKRADPAWLIGLLLKAAMMRACTARLGSLEHTREALLSWCELDWDQLEQQARRELSGGESADAKVAKAEAAQVQAPDETRKEPDTAGELISVLNLTEKQLDRGRVVEKWMNKSDATEPVKVQAFKLDGTPYVWPSAHHQNGGSSWFCRPLLTLAEFAKQFPDIKLRPSAQSLTDSQAGGYGTDCYAGVRVILDGKERVIGPKSVERVLVEPPTAEQPKRKGA